MTYHALLLISSHCNHCPAVLDNLSELVKQGELASLEIVNLEQSPQRAEVLKVRTVPWVRLAGFDLYGVRSVAEYRQWIARAGTVEGMVEWLGETLADGDVQTALQAALTNPVAVDAVFRLLGLVKLKINVRVGLGALMEELAERALLQERIDDLGALSQHSHANIRADACHYLGLSGDQTARPWLETCRNDDNRDVREIAEDSLALLSQ